MAKKGKLKDFFNDLRSEVKAAVLHVVGDINKAVSSVVGDEENVLQWLPLLPFKKPMQRILKSRGYAAPDKIDELGVSFVNNVLAKKSNFENLTDEQEAQTINTAIAAAGAGLAGPTGGISVIAAPIVAAIVQFFRKKKKEKDAGVKLAPEEEAAVNDAEKEIAAVNNVMVKIGAPRGGGGKGSVNTYTPWNTPVNSADSGNTGASGAKDNTNTSTPPASGNTTPTRPPSIPVEKKGIGGIVALISLFLILFFAFK